MILASEAKFLLRLCLLLCLLQYLEVKDTVLKIKKTKTEIKKGLEDLIINSRKDENTDMQDEVNGCITNKDAIKVIQDFEQIIQNKKSDMVWLAYYQGQVFQEKVFQKKFVSDIVPKFNVSKSSVVFKIALKLIGDFPRIRLDVVPSLFF